MTAMRPLPTFLGLTFLLSWGIAYPLTLAFPGWRDVIFLLAVVSPSLAALLTAARFGGKAGVLDLFRRFFRFRVGIVWYAAALGTLPFCSLVAAIVADRFLDVSLSEYLSGWSVLIGLANAVLYVSGVAEEMGWRGFYLPGLLGQRSPIAASVTIGLIWWIWHAPIYVLPQFGIVTQGISFSLNAFASLLMFIVLVSLLMTWIYMNASGSSFVAGALVHATSSAIPVSAENGPYFAYLACLSLVVVAVVIRGLRKLDLRRRTDPSLVA